MVVVVIQNDWGLSREFCAAYFHVPKMRQPEVNASREAARIERDEGMDDFEEEGTYHQKINSVLMS